MTAYKWQFAPRFRYHAFGWKSDKPIQRIKEALTEIKQVAKKEPALAAAKVRFFFWRKYRLPLKKLIAHPAP